MDSIFGVMGGAIAGDGSVHTWDEWKDVVAGAYKKANLEVVVIDVFIIPDISKLFVNAHDKIKGFTKGCFITIN